ncbi:MAG: choice-of-anchor V domain-containing protein [Bacteroidia bacterium]
MKSNLYRKLRTWGFTAGLVCVSMYAMTNAGGPPAENTGAPGDNTCGQSGCHNFNPIANGPLWNNIAFTSSIPTSGYVPGNTYNMTISYSHPNHGTFGFQAVMLDQNAIMSGSFTSGTGSATQTTGGGRTYINHTTGGTSGTGARSWNFTWTAPSSGMGTLTLYTAINSANGDNNNTGDTILTKAFTIYQTGTAPPTATYTVDKDTICQNDTAHFLGSATNNPLGYSWSIPGSQFVLGTTPNSQNPVVVFGSSFAGSSIIRGISLTATNSNGMSQPATGTVLVNAAPTSTTTPSGANNSICGNDSVALSAASGTYTYLWTPGNLTDQTIYVKNTGSYSVKLTNTQTGCMKTSGVIGFVKRTLPTATLNISTDSICIGDSVTLSANAGMVNYMFYGDTTLIYSGSNASVKVAPVSSSAQYTVYVTDANGCTSLASSAKQVHVQTPLAAPTVSCDAVSVSMIRFAWSAVSGADGYEASLDSGKTWMTPSSGATGLTHEINGLPAATRKVLWVRALQSTGKCAKGLHGVGNCITTGCAAVTYTLNYDSVFCNPSGTDSTTVTLSNISAATYAVMVEEVTSAGVQVSIIYQPVGSSTFKVKLKTSGSVYYRFSVWDSAQLSCPAGVKTIRLQSNLTPVANPTITFGKSTNVLCDREQATFTFSKPAGTHKFELFKNSTSLGFTTATSMQFPSSTFASNDQVYVTAMDTNANCSRNSSTITIQRKPDPKAGFTFTKDTSFVQFTDTTTGAKTWAWKFGDNGTATTQNPSHTYANGTFTASLSVITTDDCASDTASQTINISVGLATIEGIGFMQYYPNPVKSTLSIELHINTLNEPVTMEVKDLQGKLIKQQSFGKVSQSVTHYDIDLADLNNAVYMMEVKVGSATKTFTFIKD